MEKGVGWGVFRIIFVILRSVRTKKYIKMKELLVAGKAVLSRRALVALCLMAVMMVGVQAQTPLKKVYDESINPVEQVTAAVAKAKEEGKFVVCQVGGNWCPWCLRFADFISKDEEITQVIDKNFVYIHVNYNPRKSAGAEQAEVAAALMQRLGQPARFGFPVFVVLDGEGAVRHIQDSSFLEEGKGYDKAKVLRFLNNWTPQVVAQ